MNATADLRVGIDIGGTFTDLSILDSDGIVAVGKTLTTHGEPATAVAQVLEKTLTKNGLNSASVRSVVHGTTLVTNALIERRGARTALITTEGFRDVIEMGREHRYELYDLNLELPRPLVPRYLRLGVAERLLSDGAVDVPLDEEGLRGVTRELVDAGVEAVAVCFLHSHVNDSHEQRAKAIINEVAPGLRVALSSQVNPEIREYERFSTTLANVYVQGVVEDYLHDLQKRLQQIGVEDELLIMLSNGGVTTVDVARQFPIRMLESGPAGGALGAVAFGEAAGEPDLMAFDMGGTTAKLCIVERHQPLVTHAFEVDRIYRLKAGSGLPVRAPVIDMIEIGAGGGSIARIDALGLVTVGPESAGSEPGPVCYGRGGHQCTVTDADVVLGYIDPDAFLGSSMPLDKEAAEEAIRTQVAEPLSIGVPEAAWGIHATVNENMANAARVHAMERGADPAKLPMFVSGGNGPLHGPGVAQALGAPSILVPPAAGVLSTLGFLAAPVSMDVVRSVHAPIGEIDEPRIRELFGELEAEATQMLKDSGLEESLITHHRSVEMRFIGQGNEIEVKVPAAGPGWKEHAIKAFQQEYERKFGSVAPHDVGVEILTWRVRSSGPEPDTQLSFHDRLPSESAKLPDRKVYFPQEQGYVLTPVYDRYGLAQGSTGSGPALIIEPESTLVVPPGASFAVGEDLSIRVELNQSEPHQGDA